MLYVPEEVEIESEIETLSFIALPCSALIFGAIAWQGAQAGGWWWILAIIFGFSALVPTLIFVSSVLDIWREIKTEQHLVKLSRQPRSLKLVR